MGIMAAALPLVAGEPPCPAFKRCCCAPSLSMASAGVSGKPTVQACAGAPAPAPLPLVPLPQPC